MLYLNYTDNVAKEFEEIYEEDFEDMKGFFLVSLDSYDLDYTCVYQYGVIDIHFEYDNKMIQTMLGDLYDVFVYDSYEDLTDIVRIRLSSNTTYNDLAYTAQCINNIIKTLDKKSVV